MTLSALPAVLALVVQLAGDDGAPVDPLSRAVATFRSAEPAVQAALVADVRARLAESEDAGVQRLLQLRDRARQELQVVPWNGPETFDKAVYAPVAEPRVLLPVDDPATQREWNQLRVWENRPAHAAAAIRYAFGSERGLRAGPVTAEQELLDLLWGYPPDADVLIAWIQRELDFDDSLDGLADYFDHAYCDRFGHCFAGISLFDAWASQTGIEMPDTEVIAFARNVLKDRSFRSPIPGDARRQRLYDRIRADFLRYFQYRSWLEAAANVYVNPETPLRGDHEGLRGRFGVEFARCVDDLDCVRKGFVAAKNRDAWIEAIDAANDADPGRLAAGKAWQEARNASRWAIAEATYAVLREYGFLYQ